MSDKFVTSTSDHFVEGQTVVAKVTNVDEEKQRSLRLSDCTLGDLATTSLLLLSQCLEERQGVRSLMSNRGGGNRADDEGQGGACAASIRPVCSNELFGSPDI